MGTMTLAAGPLLAATSSTAAKGNPAFTFIILAVLVGLFYFLFMRPQRNRQRRAMQTQSQVMPGQRIRTTAGMYGTVVSGDDRDIVIEIAPGVHVTMLRRAVMEVIPDDVPDENLEHDEAGAHDDGASGHADEPEAEHEESTPADDWDLKDRNI